MSETSLTRPTPTPWHYFVVYRTNEGYIGNTQHDMPEQITTIGQVAEIEQAVAGKLGRRNVHVTVTDYKLLSGPARNLVVNWDTDEIVDVTLDGELISTYTHEGTDGIRAVLSTVDALAAKLGITVTVVGNPRV